MIYGNATFMGIPWETIIKIMRNKIHSDEIIFKTLEEARDYFYENIRKDYVKATIEDQKHNFKEKIIKFIQIILNDASNEIQKQFAQAKFTENAFNSKKVDFLKEGIEVVVVMHNDKPIAVDLPQKIEYTVAQTEPAVKGDTVSGNVSKDAELDNGLTVRVPIFVKNGDVIRVNTQTGEYTERVN